MVSSVSGLLKSATLHNTSAEMEVMDLDVKKGETIDFVVDFAAGLNSDMFRWPPVIAICAPADGGPDEKREWDALKEFGGVPPEIIEPLKPWEQLAQVLLLSNEFYFID
jgi:hypothetical protein